MKVADIERTLAAHTGKIEEHSLIILPVFAPEPIHKFRIGIKQLRAFLRLLASNNEQPEIKLPEKTKNLYQIVGRIREIQLEQKKLSALQLDLQLYFTKLQSELSHYKQQWREHYSHHVIRELQHEVLDHDFQPLEPAALKKFFRAHLYAIDAIVQDDPDNEHIHTCRKYVKDMQYLSKQAEKDWEGGYKALLGFPLPHLERISDKLGTYNDERIMLDRFMEASPLSSRREARVLQAACEELKESLFASKKRAVSFMQGFLEEAMLACH